MTNPGPLHILQLNHISPMAYATVTLSDWVPLLLFIIFNFSPLVLASFSLHLNSFFPSSIKPHYQLSTQFLNLTPFILCVISPHGFPHFGSFCSAEQALMLFSWINVCLANTLIISTRANRIDNYTIYTEALFRVLFVSPSIPPTVSSI